MASLAVAFLGNTGHLRNGLDCRYRPKAATREVKVDDRFRRSVSAASGLSG